MCRAPRQAHATGPHGSTHAHAQRGRETAERERDGGERGDGGQVVRVCECVGEQTRSLLSLAVTALGSRPLDFCTLRSGVLGIAGSFPFRCTRGLVPLLPLVRGDVGGCGLATNVWPLTGACGASVCGCAAAAGSARLAEMQNFCLCFPSAASDLKSMAHSWQRSTWVAIVRLASV